MRVSRGWVAVVVAGALALGASACDHSRIGSAAGQLAPDNAASLKVTNDNLFAMAIFVVTNGVPVRLGTVMANQAHTFRVDPSLVPTAQLRVLATPIGSTGGATTGTLLIKAGDLVDFRITTMLSQSTTIIP